MKSNNKSISEYTSNNIINIEEIINQYSGYLYTIIKNISKETLSIEDIEEIISDTFFVLWKNQEKLNIEKQLSSYLAGITKNLLKEKYRNRYIYNDISEYENILFEKQDIDMICQEREKNNIILNSIKDMKEEDSQIFKLYYYSSKKVKEISEYLGISQSKVKTKLYRIRKKIKINLDKGGYRL